MSIERVKAYFDARGMLSRVWELDVSTASVALAAEALDVRPARIAKTLSFRMGDGCVLVVAAGDARVDNRRFRERFGVKARMLAPDEVERMTGSAVGGVCPFALPEGVPVYLDRSLCRFATVFPACGSENSAIELSCNELFRYSNARDWVDVCAGWEAGDDSLIDDVPNPDLAMPSDGELTLAIEAVTQADEKTGYVPAYRFGIVRLADGLRVGMIDLRLGYVRNTFYGGNIGYAVDEPYRGHAYARKAARLVFEVARAHRMPYVMISCAAGNLPSRRTLEGLGGTLLAVCEPPRYSGLYREAGPGDRCYFRFLL